MKSPKLLNTLDTHNLTVEQQNIVTTNASYCEVVASAGCGKTSTLVARRNWLITNELATSDQILCLSFSKSTVAYLGQLLGSAAQTQTFHSYAFSIAASPRKSHQSHYPGQLLTDAQRMKLVQQAVAGSGAEHECKAFAAAGIKLSAKFEIRRLARFYERIQGDGKIARNLVSDPHSGYSDYLPLLKQIKTIHTRYRKLKRDTGKLDYVDMLDIARDILGQAETVLQYRYLLVDECQDMSRGQAQLLQVLSSHVPNITLFGDKNQAIYGFAGQRHWALKELLPDRCVTIFPLSHSFRLTQHNADLAGAVQNANGPGLGAPLHIHCTTKGVRPRLYQCGSQSVQQSEILRIIEKLREEGVDFNQIAILGRVKAQLKDVEQSLRADNIETRPIYRAVVPIHMLKLLSILRLLEIYGRRDRKLTRADGAAISSKLQTIFGSELTEAKVKACVSMFASALKSKRSLTGLYDVALRLYEKMLRAENKLTADVRTQLGNYQQLCHGQKSVKQLRTVFACLNAEKSVITSTIHQAKGLEWDYVIVINVVEGSLPFYKASPDQLDEERNLLYVALTRARKRVFVMEAPYQKFHPAKEYALPSSLIDKPAVHKTLTVVNSRVKTIIGV